MAKKKLVVLTGAGISAESGIKTFRDTNGLWENYSVEDVATPMGWLKNKELVLQFYNERRREVMNVQPNMAHYKLAELQDKFDMTIITQNIDDLHERAGSKRVLHLHGEILKSQSSKYPELVYECKGDINMGDKCAECSQLRPNVVWFGEAVPLIMAAEGIAWDADYFVVIGTSMQVYPAAGLIERVQDHAKILIVDPNRPVIPARFRNVTTFYIEGYDVSKNMNKATFIEKKATEGILDMERILLADIEKIAV